MNIIIGGSEDMQHCGRSLLLDEIAILQFILE